MNDSLERLAETRAELIGKMAGLLVDKGECEAKILESLIDKKMWDCFTINWRKLDRMMFGGRRTRRMDG